MGELAESLGAVRSAYGARASEYVDLLGGIEHTAEPDRMLIERWARSLAGRVRDVGCGPGQWTSFLAGLGVDAVGVDPVPAFLESAQANYPGIQFRSGRAEALDAADAALGGVLAWYSLIHSPPDQIGTALSEFGRCLRIGGGLALGFFTGPRLEPFDHAVTTAYFWPVDLLAEEVEAAGFTVTHTETRTDRPGRTHGALLAING